MKVLGVVIFCFSLCLGWQAARAEETAAPADGNSEADAAWIERAKGECNCTIYDNDRPTDDRAEYAGKANADLGGKTDHPAAGEGNTISEPKKGDSAD